MNIISINVDQGGCMDTPLLIGYAGEDSVEAVVFDFSPWAEAYGPGTITLEVMRASDTAPYTPLLTIDGTTARWTISDVDTARRGPGVAQLIYMPDTGTKKSAVFKFYVGKSIRSDEDPDPWQDLLNRLEELLGEMQQEAADTQENATAADQSAQDAAASALAASGSEVNAGISAGAAAESEGNAAASESNAEAWAVGERGGEPVADTDPAFENNAKYYAGLASASATAAEDAAPFYAVYGITTASEISSALNRKGQVFLRTLDERSIAPFITEFRWSRPGAAGRGFRFAKIEGTVQHVYELTDTWTNYTNDLNAPAQRAEEAADQALNRMNSADQSAQSAAGSASNASRDAGTASTAATTATTKAGEASDSATAADGSAKDAEAYAVGKRGGTDVGSTDPAYHNNAKYYAEQASDNATAAGNAQTAAETAQGKAEDAQTAAETAQGKAEDAQEAAEQAQEAAEAVLESIPSDYTELSDDVDDLKSAKAPAIINTASGAIASFDDGADGMPIKSLTVNIEPVQEGNGDPSPTNVRHISGWTGANLARTAKNLGNFADNKAISTSGFIADVDGRVTTVDPVVINPGKTYKAVCNNASAKVILAVWNGDTLVRRKANLNVGTVLDTTGGTYFYVCCYMTGSVPVTVDEIEPMVVFADETDLTYAPYQGAVYPITFPTEAGTVYKGALDVVKKELTMLYYGAAINDCNWTYSETTGFFTATDFKTGIYAAKRPATNTIAAKIIAEEFQTTPVNTSVGFDISVSASGNIIIKAPGFTTVADLLNNFGSSKFLFELASPVVYQLTVARITTLFGTNNIWADCGPVSVDYPADTKLYIDALTAPTEDDMIANARIESGKYFMVGNALYLSTALILTGETIIPGTNCQKTNLAAALNALNT